MSVIKEEKIILVGKSGSGKDYLLRALVKKGLKYSPKFTTRPKRSREIDGVEYNFIDNSLFEEMKESGLIKVYQTFDIKGQTWHYGITEENFLNNQAFIMTPDEISQLDSKHRLGCFVVYLDIDYSVRLQRLTKRKDFNDSMERRLQADEIDFSNFSDYDLKITDPEFDTEIIIDLMI